MWLDVNDIFIHYKRRAYINFEVHAGSALHVDDVRSQVGEEGLQVGGGVPAINIAMRLDYNQNKK